MQITKKKTKKSPNLDIQPQFMAQNLFSHRTRIICQHTRTIKIHQKYIDTHTHKHSHN